jgi:hypothetical protein
MSEGDAELRRHRWILIGILLIGCVLLAERELNPYVLVTEVPAAIKIPSVLAGLILGVWLSMLVHRIGELRGKEMGLRAKIGVGLLPLLIAPVGSYIGRRAFEIVAFSGDIARPTGAVEGAISSSWRRRSKITVVIDPSLRDLDIPVDYRADYSAIGRFCILLPVEAGRYGAIRTRLPTLFEEPVHLDTFRPCSSNVLERNPSLAQRVKRIEARSKN